MYESLNTQLAKERQADIARSASHGGPVRFLLRRPARIRRGLRPALPGGGMLPSWHHGSPARGS